MSTRYAKFAPENELAAEAFADFQNTALEATSPALVAFERRYDEDLGAEFQAGHIMRDTNLNWVVAYAFDGPFEFGGATIPAPEGVADMLTLAVIVDTPDWYEFD